MPNLRELVDNIALELSEKSIGDLWFTNRELENAYSQLVLDEITSRQFIFNFLCANKTATYQFFTSLYGMEHISNEFLRAMDSKLRSIAYTNCF